MALVAVKPRIIAADPQMMYGEVSGGHDAQSRQAQARHALPKQPIGVEPGGPRNPSRRTLLIAAAAGGVAAAAAAAGVTISDLGSAHRRPPPTRIQPPVRKTSKVCMINVVTYTDGNNLGLVQENARIFSHLTIFGAYPTTDGGIKFTGQEIDGVHIPKVISWAHRHGIKVMFGFGGSGNAQKGNAQFSAYQAICADDNLIKKTAMSVARHIKEMGYDGIQPDFENYTGGDFNQKGYTELIRQIRHLLGSAYQIDVTFADWETSIDIVSIATYATRLLDLFPTIVAANGKTATGLDFSAIDADARRLLRPGQMEVVFDLFETDGGSYLPLTQQDLTRLARDGYGVGIWNAQQLTQELCTLLSSAGF